jgi:putative heme-binding domain-containing protein
MPHRQRRASILLLSIVILARPRTAGAGLGAEAPAGGKEPDLAPLVAVLLQVDDAAFQLDILAGMREGLKGRKRLAAPAGWSEAYARLAKSQDAAVREEATALALVFGDAAALGRLRAVLVDRSAPGEERERALETLAAHGAPDLLPTLLDLLADGTLRRPVLRALAAYGGADVPRAVLARYGSLSAEERRDAVETLAARADHALALLDAVEKGTVPRGDISAFTARQIQSLGKDAVLRRLGEVWGEVRKTSADKAALIARYKGHLAPASLAAADISRGRGLYNQTCAQCHSLYGEGATIGPDITGSNRANLDYILENVLDPSATIGRDYQLTVAVTRDGRVVSGIVVDRSAASITLQTVNERVLLSKEDVVDLTTSAESMMPEGQLDKLSSEEIRDLVAYLATTEQVPLPAPAPPEARFEAAGTRFVRLLVEEKYEAAGAMLSAALAREVTAAALKASFVERAGPLGAVERLGPPTLAPFQEYRLVFVPLLLEKGRLRMEVTLDSEARVVGYFWRAPLPEDEETE